MKKKKTIKIKNVVLEIPVAVMLIILTLLVLVPVIWMVFSAFKPEKEIISWPPTFIPNSFTLENFTDVQDRIDILRHRFRQTLGELWQHLPDAVGGGDNVSTVPLATMAQNDTLGHERNIRD